MRQLTITAVGHVDHGKSTLLGRLLHDTGSIPRERIAAVEARCAEMGRPFEYAFLLDALQEEQLKNITIDLCRFQFKSRSSSFTLIDAPGHKEFLKNMVSGAASADGVVLLVDALEGMLDQTRRHAYLLGLLDIRQIVVAINKMDKVGYSREVFERGRREVEDYLRALGLAATATVPVAASHGANVTSRSSDLAWYSGLTLLEQLEQLVPREHAGQLPFRFPIQDVYRRGDRRVAVGRLESGTLHEGDRLRFWPSGREVRVEFVHAPESRIHDQFGAGKSIALLLPPGTGLARGGDWRSLGRLAAFGPGIEGEPVLAWTEAAAEGPAVHVAPGHGRGGRQGPRHPQSHPDRVPGEHDERYHGGRTLRGGRHPAGIGPSDTSRPVLRPAPHGSRGADRRTRCCRRRNYLPELNSSGRPGCARNSGRFSSTASNKRQDLLRGSSRRRPVAAKDREGGRVPPQVPTGCFECCGNDPIRLIIGALGPDLEQRPMPVRFPGIEGSAEEIHHTSLSLLIDPGIRIEHENILNLLLARGAKPGLKSGVVRLPRELIEDSLARCPHRFVLTDRRGEGTLLAAGGPAVFWSVPGMALYRRGQHRPFLSSDMADVARLLDQLDNVQAIFGLAMEDVPPPARDVVGLKIIAENSGKHIRVLCFSPEGADALVEMKPVVGNHPWFSIGFTAHGPLRWTHLALEIFRRTAGAGIPVTVNGEPMAGVSAPVTLAGTAAVGNAEILAGIAINQLLEPGRPCIYNLGLAHVFDMRTAIAVTGAPENALLAQISSVMGRFYDLPSASWVSTESMCPDSQAALEKMFGFYTHMAGGVTNIWGVGQLESELTLSTAQAVIDNEMISFARRFERGVQFNDASLAMDVVRSVGIAGSFLETEHTLENYRSEFFFPSILCRIRRAGWTEEGGKRLDQKAEEVADHLIAKSVANYLSVEQIRELEAIASRHVSAVSWSGTNPRPVAE